MTLSSISWINSDPIHGFRDEILCFRVPRSLESPKLYLSRPGAFPNGKANLRRIDNGTSKAVGGLADLSKDPPGRLGAFLVFYAENLLHFSLHAENCREIMAYMDHESMLIKPFCTKLARFPPSKYP